MISFLFILLLYLPQIEDKHSIDLSLTILIDQIKEERERNCTSFRFFSLSLSAIDKHHNDHGGHT